MIPSVAELQSSLLKAGRGLGLPLGIAEDIATAAPFFLAADEPNETFAQLLREMESGHVTRVIEAIDAALCDGEAEIADSRAARALVASASYRAQRILVLKASRVVAEGPAKIARPFPRRKMIDDGLWDRLQGFAARTYVPASEASREKGAGAGLTDND
ncbi:MAG: hypothetical protein AAGK92_03585 [Pseudomonadota bacterium]